MAMKALILVMSARRAPWGALMDASLETWDAVENPQTQTLYYIGKSDYPKGPKVYMSTSSDHLHDLSARTMQALAHSLTIPDWEFMARPNSSCYVHKANLVKHLETLPKTGVMKGLVSTDHRGPWMWGGGQYIFSRDVVETLVSNRHKYDEILQEDEAISKLARMCGIEFDGTGMLASIDSTPGSNEFRCLLYGGGESFTFTDFAEMEKAGGHFFFRLKQDYDRTIDLRIMRELKANL